MDNRKRERIPAFGIRQFLFVLFLAVILFLLGQSMMRHRFFQGEREQARFGPFCCRLGGVSRQSRNGRIVHRMQAGGQSPVED
jgi:hypothetical protein